MHDILIILLFCSFIGLLCLIFVVGAWAVTHLNVLKQQPEYIYHKPRKRAKRVNRPPNYP